MSTPLKIAIVHLDLGQGGAERQTIDEAIALKANGHDVTIYTSHHDRNRCFDETIDDKILGKDIQVFGDWIPRHVFGRLHALMSIYRMLWCSLRVLWSDTKYDIICVDQVSAVIPFLKLKKNAKVVYYCHFPDLLLVQNKQKSSSLKQKYRAMIDWFEAVTTANCDELLVNSKFTKQVVLQTFSFLQQMPYLEPNVVYPAIDTEQFQSINTGSKSSNKRVTFLSINRYERKKQIHLAIKALHKLFSMLKETKNVKLVIAGGYDERVMENKEYFEELMQICKQIQIKYQFLKPEMFESEQSENEDEDALILDNKHVDVSASIYFITKFPDKQKEELLKECSAVLYTPENEHFGIVPIEAMLAMRPPIACKSGGPLETIVDGETGFLCGNNEEEWAAAMKKFVEDRELTLKLGKAGRQRVIDCFSRKELQNVMQRVVDGVKDKKFRLPQNIRLQTWLITCFIFWTFVNAIPVLLVLSKFF